MGGGALAPSHWVLDFLTHRPDLPVVPWGAEELGLGLWNHVAATVAVEGTVSALWMAWVDRLRQTTGLASVAVAGASGPP